MWGFIIALISGALMSVQGVFNTEVTKQTSLWVSTGWVQLSAFAVCVFAWLFTGRESVAALWLGLLRDVKMCRVCFIWKISICCWVVSLGHLLL